jgi:hypothetical protein
MDSEQAPEQLSFAVNRYIKQNNHHHQEVIVHVFQETQISATLTDMQ